VEDTFHREEAAENVHHLEEEEAHRQEVEAELQGNPFQVQDQEEVPMMVEDQMTSIQMRGLEVERALHKFELGAVEVERQLVDLPMEQQLSTHKVSPCYNKRGLLPKVRLKQRLAVVVAVVAMD